MVVIPVPTRGIDLEPPFLQMAAFVPQGVNLSIQGEHWFAVQTQPGREPLAAEQLGRQGFTVFFPRRAKMVRHARRMERRIISYFPGYIFVRLDLTTSAWRSINGTFGVRALVMFGDRPAQAPAALIDGLKTLIDANGFIAPTPQFTVGDTVKITEGPFAELMGAVERVDGQARVRILIDLLSGAVPIVTDVSHVALAS